jgi:hypothetical protein
MNEPIRLAAEARASETLEMSRSFETFHDAESRVLLPVLRIGALEIVDEAGFRRRLASR